MKNKMTFLKITHGTENLKRMTQKNLSKIIITQDIVLNQSAFESLSPKPSNARQIIFIEDVFDVIFYFESAAFLAAVEQFTKS